MVKNFLEKNMRQEESTLSSFEELVVVKGAMELGFITPNTIESYLDKFYQALQEGKTYSLLGVLTQVAGISESQVDFLKDGVLEDRQNNQLPPAVDIQSRLAVLRFLGLSAPNSNIGTKSPQSKIASVLQTRNAPKPVISASIPTPITKSVTNKNQEANVRSIPTITTKNTESKLGAKTTDAESLSSDTVSIACPDCQFRYRIRRTSKSNKFRCVQCKISFYVIPRNPAGNTPQDWIITKSLPENIFATKTVDIGISPTINIPTQENSNEEEDSLLNLAVNKISKHSKVNQSIGNGVNSAKKTTISINSENSTVPPLKSISIAEKTVPQTKNSVAPVNHLSLNNSQNSNPLQKIPTSTNKSPLATTSRNSGLAINKSSLATTARNIALPKPQEEEGLLAIPPQKYATEIKPAPGKEQEDDSSVSNASDILNIRAASSAEDINTTTMELDIRGTDLFKKVEGERKKDSEYEDVPDVSTKEIATKNIEDLTAHLSDVEAAAIVRHALNYDLVTIADVKILVEKYFKQFENNRHDREDSAQNLATLLVKDGHITKYQYATLKSYVDKDKKMQRLPNYKDILERTKFEQYLGIFEQKKALRIVCPYCQAKFIAKININGGKFRCGKCQKKFFMAKPQS